MLCKLQKRKCHIFRQEFKGTKRVYTPITAAKADLGRHYWAAFDVVKPTQKSWGKHYITNRPDDRADPLLVKVVEKLGRAASGTHAELKIVEIPEGMQYQIEDYDGMETIHEKHRSWE